MWKRLKRVDSNAKMIPSPHGRSPFSKGQRGACYSKSTNLSAHYADIQEILHACRHDAPAADRAAAHPAIVPFRSASGAAQRHRQPRSHGFAAAAGRRRGRGYHRVAGVSQRRGCRCAHVPAHASVLLAPKHVRRLYAGCAWRVKTPDLPSI